ncbi:ribonuclease D [Povalibacter sp.]|uniref:ribonuclease D n=1 Tax=Povalibacter sp. TaxID=1962978 RepID=UPI002F40AF7E
MTPALRIATNEELRAALEMLSGSTFVALDTEFMRERTYYAGLCLIQLATPDACAIIDPLARIDLQPLWEFLCDRSRLKVLHSGRQDLEVLSFAMAPPTTEGAVGRVPGPLFDTQVAAALLGSPAQAGYATVVSERLGHTLPKGQTRTDWSRRPLSPEQVEYAADDVRYLVPLYQNLTAALTARGRLDWLIEESLELEDPTLYRIDPTDAWRRLKGLDRLRPDQRAVAKLMAQWREARAMRKDKPRGWILADESLRDIAERVPANRTELDAIPSLSANFLRKRSEEILGLIAQGRTNAATEAPAMIPARPDPRLVAQVTRLLAIVREEAQRQEIAPELLATRRDVERLVFSGRADHLLQGWRRDVIGQRLVTLAAEPAASG